MATPGRTPFVQVSHEIFLALRLFGRLNGTEWEVVATVMEQSWGHVDGYKDDAVLGMADFRAASLKCSAAIQKALIRLGDGSPQVPGFRVLRIIEPPTSRSPTVWAVQRDWEIWAWESPEHLAAAQRIIRHRFRDRPAADEDYLSADAIALGKHLRELAATNNPGAAVPAVDAESPAWRAWCRELQAVLNRDRRPESPTHSPEAVRVVLTHAFTHEFWAQRLRGPQAAARVAQDYDTLVALAQTPRQRGPR